MATRNPFLPSRWLSRALLLIATLLPAAASHAALLDINADLTGQQPLITFNNTAAPPRITYDSTTDDFALRADPVFGQFPLNPFAFISPDTATSTRLLSINIKVDATGAFSGGAPGDDLVLRGQVDTDGDFVPDADGELLTGEVTAFGYLDSGSTSDQYDFRFTVTGGLLAADFGGVGASAGVAVLASENSTFAGSFSVSFSGGAKGNLGPVPPPPPEPSIEICKLVSITGADPFFDADATAGDGCDAFPQGVPSGVAGLVDATYRLVVVNTGNETLIDARVSDTTLGLVDVPVPGGPLAPGEVRIINSGDADFGALFVADRCEGTPGTRNNVAEVRANGETSGTEVSDDDDANVKCVVEPDISLRKQVSIDGGAHYFDADTPATGPTGPLGTDALYQMIVKNTGTETLVNVRITDATLGLADVPVPGGPMAPGDERILTSGSIGFDALDYQHRCDSVGNKLNIARVDGDGQSSGTPVSDENPANVNCENPQIELLKQVSLTGGEPFFDADNAGDPDVPVGLVGSTDATYRLIVRNIGTETLVDGVVNDLTLGIVNVSIGAPLLPGEERTLDTGDISQLYFPGRCDGTGIRSNIASVQATGDETGAAVSDDNPANVRCIQGPAVRIVKRVSLTGLPGSYVDADDPGGPDVPVGLLGADAYYQLEVANIGDETLVNPVDPTQGPVVSDPTLGIVNAQVPGGPMLPGDVRVLDAGSLPALLVHNRCDSVGNKMNVATVDAAGLLTGKPVSDDNPANLRCDTPLVCDVAVDKKCLLPPPPSGDLLCQAPIKATTLRYIGPTRLGVTVRFEGDKKGDVTYTNVDLIQGVTILTQGSQNDFTIDASVSGGDSLGAKTYIYVNGTLEEIIHTSCSAVYVAGAPAPLDGGTPNPPNSTKGDPSPDWFVVNFEDKDGGYLEAPPASGADAADACTLTSPEPTGTLCTAPIKATTLRYIGPDRTGVTVRFKGDQKGDVTYGPVDLASGVTVLTSPGQNGYTVDAASTGGDAFGSKLYVYINGVLEEIIHTSCSAVYEAGAPAPLDAGTPNPPNSSKGDPSPNWYVEDYEQKDGAVVSGSPGTVDVTYRYTVTNVGSTIVDLSSVFDDQLGEQLASSPLTLLPGESTVIETSTAIAVTTTNNVVVTANVQGDPASTCSAGDQVTVTVEPPPPPPVSCNDIKPITSLSMVWDGPDGVDVSTAGGQVFENLVHGSRITFSTAGLGNDVDIFLSGAVNGTSRFHVSCSDDAMNGSDDCGTRQGDGKDDQSSRINDWLLDGMAGTGGGFTCGVPNSGTVDPSAGPGPGGSVTGDAGGPQATKNEFKWKLTNNGSQDIFVTEVQVSWPAAQGNVKELKFNKDKFAEKLSAPPPSATFTLADFVSDANKRKIKHGETREFKVKFDTDYQGDVPADYTLTVTFDNGASISFP